MRKTLRYRASNINTLDPNERRKSRRHSTGTSPLIHQLSPTTNNHSPKIYHGVNNLHQTADEDSSSSANSGELNDVFNVTKQNRESAGVTPGLRRRRERAERQKTFIREQEDAVAAASARPIDENKSDDLNRHGKYFFFFTFNFKCFFLWFIYLLGKLFYSIYYLVYYL